jgi:hypothetical protein
MSTLKFKDIINSPDGLNVFFVVIFVAFGLTIYELSMFFYLVAPDIKIQINNSLLNISYIIKSMLPNTNNNIDETINNNIINNKKMAEILPIIKKFNIMSVMKNVDSSSLILQSKKEVNNILEVLNEREEILTSKINDYTKITGLGILITLVIIMVLIYYRLKEKLKAGIQDKTKYLCLYTFVLIMGFQYFFYYYGQNYFYSNGKELNAYILKNL